MGSYVSRGIPFSLLPLKQRSIATERLVVKTLSSTVLQCQQLLLCGYVGSLTTRRIFNYYYSHCQSVDNRPQSFLPPVEVAPFGEHFKWAMWSFVRAFYKLKATLRTPQSTGCRCVPGASLLARTAAPESDARHFSSQNFTLEARGHSKSRS